MAIKNNIVTKKTTELVLVFHKKKTKLVFWPNMGQLGFKMLSLVFNSSKVSYNLYGLLKIKFYWIIGTIYNYLPSSIMYYLL